MRRVAYVCTDPGVPVFGSKGASVHVQAVLRVLVEQGAEVHLLATRPSGDVPADLAAVHVHRLAMPASVNAAEHERAVQAADARVGLVLDAIGPDLVYERYALWGRTATAWARRDGVPSVLEVNAPLIEEQVRHRQLVDRAGAEAVVRAALSAAGKVVCVSEAVAAWARARSDRPDRVHTVANGVDTGRIRPAAHPPSEQTFTVGFVGTLKPWHGAEHLMSAMAFLADADPSYRLLLVGDGPQAEALAMQARAAGVEEVVEMTGAVSPEQIPGLLQRMHVAVAPYPPTPDFYFSPLKIYEYFAAGLPVVATRVGDLPRALEHGRLGVLVEPGEPLALASAVAGLRADSQLRGELGRSVRAAAVEQHDWSGVVARVVLSEATEVSHGIG